jgi:hypothetical protein
LNHNSTLAKNTRQQQRIQTITQDCAYHLMETQSAPSAQQASAQKYPLQFICDWASLILDDKAGDLLEYQHLLKHLKYNEVWSQSLSKEIRQLATTTGNHLFPHETRNFTGVTKRHHVRSHCVHTLL